MALDPRLTGTRRAEDGLQLHLKDYLPGHLEQSEVGEFIDFFENFLNDLYYHNRSERGLNENFEVDSDGVKTFYAISADSNGNTLYDTSGYPVRYETSAVDKVGILEKARRLTDLHDTDFIDIEYIQRLAKLLGYNIVIEKDQITDLNFGVTTDDPDDIDKYLRFVISNLPNWYKIKTTRNSIKTLLYSFGIVGDLIYKWTDSNITSANPTSGGYSNDESKWERIYAVDEDSEFFDDLIPSNYFPTPHFSIRIDASQTPAVWRESLNNIIKAVDNIRPLNNVFDELLIVFEQSLEPVYVRMDTYDNQKEIFPFNTSYSAVP